MYNFDAYKWKQRLVLVFAATAEDARLQAQLQQLEAHQAAFAERDTLVVQVIDSAARDDAHAARERYGVQLGVFAVALVGKDGTAKEIEYGQVAPAQLLAKIDSMPMRQQER